MELWEKEYLETLQDKSSKKCRIWANNHHFSRALKKALEFVFVGMIIAVLLVVCAVRNGHFAQFQSAGEITIKSASYVDGYKFHDMMTFLDSCETDCTMLAKECLNNFYSLDDSRLWYWKSKLTSIEDQFAQLKYDSTYQELIVLDKEILSLSFDLIQEIESKSDVEGCRQIYNGIVEKLNSVRDVTVSVLKKNGISYEILTDGTLRYFYKKY